MREGAKWGYWLFRAHDCSETFVVLRWRAIFKTGDEHIIAAAGDNVAVTSSQGGGDMHTHAVTVSC